MEKEKVCFETFCDFCGEPAWNKCLGCGKDLCYRCCEDGVLAKRYPHAIHFSGSYDGHYCGECDRKLTESGLNALHNAYRKIIALRAESNSWYKDFDKRASAVEAEITALRKED